ncbi:MAG: DUF5685 family protein [Oscillospiraceae bacterium]|nr:DUF5685 family protein [Oscillospiraceae bacterium]
MFGYIIANKDLLASEQLDRYKSCYCGLCRALHERHGTLACMTLNCDMTFLILLLPRLNEPEESDGDARCAVHPTQKNHWSRSVYTLYGADMNVALAYYNALDDWHDARRAVSLAESKALKRGFERAQESWPRQCGAISSCLARLGELEKENSPDADAAANAFGELLGELFVYDENDYQSKWLRSFGEKLGRFIYMMDACVDLEKDIRRGQYNPFAAMRRSDMSEEEKRSILTALIAEAAEEFEALPMLQDVDIMRNILYCGVWTQYELKLKKKGGAEDDK